MSEPVSSPEIEEVEEVEDIEEVEEVEDDDYECNEAELFGEEDPEDIIDEDIDGEGDIEEEEKLGLDLEMADGYGDGYQDQDEIDGAGLPNEIHGPNKTVHQQHHNENTTIQAAGTVGEVCNADERDVREKDVLNGSVTKQKVDSVAPFQQSSHPEKKREESKNDLLSQPEHGSEVFVGNISKDTMEDDLREFCAACGDIFEVRVMRDKDRLDSANKGFAFVTFSKKEYAQKAIETLNDCELKGRKLRISPSQLKNKLFIGNIPKSWGNEELEKVLSENGHGIQKVDLVKDPQNPERNRGFAFVEYYNHACAEHSRRMLSAPGFKLGSSIPTISWADSPSGADYPGASQVRVVYVRNLPESATQEQLSRLFEHHGEITRVMLPQSKPGQAKRDFAFIHFADRNSALKAIEKSEKYVLDGRELETSLAKPPSDKKGNATVIPSSVNSGLLPQSFPARARLGFPGPNMYGGMQTSLGARGFGQPVIYGRGPTPAGMAVVPMMLPDGRIGYVLQQAGPGIPPPVINPSTRASRLGSGSVSAKQNSGNSRRYRPY
ncbi:hypothetical protein KP509_02G039700 [Ceratopteris richardii]|uniref:RRM domain-containing protein n=1 Tax=Ceratopteris richardii TaxID=49495 RepID=A0A8T2VD42_CERRI|nr:hypothetical protein KP509_02G039700 [Ceratopteris richardii]KAH7443545.1 hypothetical protein KP509_02G039700 [Ceratopteris richardii]